MSHPVTIVMIEDDDGHARLIEKNIRRANISNEIKHFADGGSAMDHLFSEEVRAELKKAYRLLFASSYNVSQALERARQELRPLPEVERFLSFIESSERGITVQR